MRVKLIETVEVDAEAWAQAYGICLNEVRADVQLYFSGIARLQIEVLGLAPKEESGAIA